jgi:hypothetical protein
MKNTIPRLVAAAALLALAGCGDSDPFAGAVLAPQDPVEDSESSLPTVASGHRPGPDVLYAEPAVAPQLQNTGVWAAEPILISGAVAYRDGEFLYQDFLYDDHGAMGVIDPSTPYGVGDYLFSPVAGTFTYPTDVAKYGDNAADLVEWRVKPLPDATAFRVTLNTLLDSTVAAFTIALADPDASPASAAWPHGAGVSSDASHFITVNNSTAELQDASGNVLEPSPIATVDLARRQIEVIVPHAAWNPGERTIGMTVGAGLWDAAGNSYLAPSIGEATATTPGGGSPLGAAIVNVGPRLDEPMPAITEPYPPFTIGDAAAGGMVQAHWWRERAQADALLLGDVSGFVAQVDFGKLAVGVDDDSAVPKTGPLNRILASHYTFGQGLDRTRVCFDIPSSFEAGAACEGNMVGQLQPYAIYVPDGPKPERGWGMTLLLHSLSANYNQYSASKNQSQLALRGEGSIVVTPSGRGPDGFYAGFAEADTFEVWADVARHYPLDPDWVAVSGYSMGGFGTYRMLARWPDLFARGFSVVGEPGSALPGLASLRNTPLMNWNAVADELVNLAGVIEAQQALTDLGLRHVQWIFPAADHLTLATNDEYQPGADFLGTHRVDRDPPHITYVVNTAEDNEGATMVADHAYWLSQLQARDPSLIGTIDVRSEGFGVADPTVLDLQNGAGVLMGGTHGPSPYVEQKLEWSDAPAAPVADRLHVIASNIARVAIDPMRARVSCGADVQVESDGPIDVQLEGC